MKPSVGPPVEPADTIAQVETTPLPQAPPLFAPPLMAPPLTSGRPRTRPLGVALLPEVRNPANNDSAPPAAVQPGPFG